MIDDDRPPDIKTAPQAEQDHVARLLREGAVTFEPEALAKMRALGMTEDEVIAMMLRSMGGAH